jgi:hypothetical protein
MIDYRGYPHRRKQLARPRRYSHAHHSGYHRRSPLHQPCLDSHRWRGRKRWPRRPHQRDRQLLLNLNLSPPRTRQPSLLASATDTKKGKTTPVHMLVRTRLSGQSIDAFLSFADTLSKLFGCWTSRRLPGKPRADIHPQFLANQASLKASRGTWTYTILRRGSHAAASEIKRQQ